MCSRSTTPPLPSTITVFLCPPPPHHFLFSRFRFPRFTQSKSLPASQGLYLFQRDTHPDYENGLMSSCGKALCCWAGPAAPGAADPPPGAPHPDGETRCWMSSFRGGFCVLAWKGFCCCCSKGFRAAKKRGNVVRNAVLARSGK